MLAVYVITKSASRCLYTDRISFASLSGKSVRFGRFAGPPAACHSGDVEGIACARRLAAAMAAKPCRCAVLVPRLCTAERNQTERSGPLREKVSQWWREVRRASPRLAKGFRTTGTMVRLPAPPPVFL